MGGGGVGEIDALYGRLTNYRHKIYYLAMIRERNGLLVFDTDVVWFECMWKKKKSRRRRFMGIFFFSYYC